MLKSSATSELQKPKDTSHHQSCRLPSEHHSFQRSTSPSVTSCRLVPLSKSSGSHQARNSKSSINLLPAQSTLVSGTGENEKTSTAKLKYMASSTGQLGTRMTHATPNDSVEDMTGSVRQLLASSKGISGFFLVFIQNMILTLPFGGNIKRTAV